MAGSAMTFTETLIGSVKKVKCAWTTDSTTGAVDGTTTNTYSGRFIGLVTVPSTTAAPSDNYTVTIKDADGVDLLLGAAVTNRDTANTEFITEASISGAAMSKLTFGIAAAGNSKQGAAYLLVR